VSTARRRIKNSTSPLGPRAPSPALATSGSTSNCPSRKYIAGGSRSALSAGGAPAVPVKSLNAALIFAKRQAEARPLRRVRNRASKEPLLTRELLLGGALADARASAWKEPLLTRGLLLGKSPCLRAAFCLEAALADARASSWNATNNRRHARVVN
jgi:hypothetical protein